MIVWPCERSLREALDAVQGDVPPPPHQPGRLYRVTARWLLDSDKFNEWMNPVDYEDWDDDAEQQQQQCGLCVPTVEVGNLS